MGLREAESDQVCAPLTICSVLLFKIKNDKIPAKTNTRRLLNYAVWEQKLNVNILILPLNSLGHYLQARNREPAKNVAFYRMHYFPISSKFP